jgi:hypothetical protein
MRSILKKSVLLACVFLLLAGANANAALANVLNVKVPFPFVVNGQSFPAGRYSVQREDLTSSVLLIRAETGNHAATFVSTLPAGGQDPAGKVPVLTFNRYESQYRLSKVWESGSQGWTVIGR